MLCADAGRSNDYWDSNVWVAYSLEDDDPHYDACRPLFDDLRDGKRTVDVSGLVIGEVIQVIRRETARIVVRGRGSGGAPSPQAAQSAADKAVRVFFQRLGRLSDTGRVVIRRPPRNARRYTALSLKLLIRHGGRFEPHGKVGLIYRGLGILDIMHALTARDYGAGSFCTRDRQFSALAGDPAFDAIRFVVF